MRRRSPSGLVVFVLALALALGGLPLPGVPGGGVALAAPCTVTVTTDDARPPDAGSLRQKLEDPTCDAIGFALPGNGPWAITLTEFLPTIIRPVVITGPSAGLTINRNESSSTVFTVGSGGNLTLRGLTLTGAGTGLSLASGGVATLIGVTVTNNATHAIAFNGGGSATLINSTVAANPRNGLFFNASGTATLINSTIARNGASGGVGISSTSSSGSLTLINTLLAKSNNANCGLSAGVLNAQSRNNLADDASCFDNTGPGSANRVVGAGATGLDPAGLQGNSGPTRTIALTTTSPARDAGDAAACAAAPLGGAGGVDQRGFPRPAGPCDIGAFERQPPTCTVTRTADDQNAGTLRACLALTDIETIGFALPGGGPWSITLATDLPLITRPVAIAGPTAGLTINRNDTNGTGIAVGNGGNLTLAGLTITRANTGLLLTGNGAATLTNAIVTGNGVGVYLSGSAIVTLINSSASGNTTGLSLLNGGTATLTNSTVSGGNVGVGVVGGGTVTLTNSTVADNSLYGLYLHQNMTATLRNSTISGNNTGLHFEGSGTATLINSTVAANQNGLYFSQGGVATLTNSTVAGNTQIGLRFLGGSATLINTLLAQVGTGGNCSLLGGGTINARSYNNLADDASCFANGSGPGANRVVGAGAAGLDPAGLRDNGGPTRTIALTVGSPALDTGAADPCANAAGGKDQRGVARPQRAACDIGAFELRFHGLTTATAGTGTGTVTADPAGGTYAEGTTVALQAAPTGGSTFAGWTVDGVAAGSANPLKVVMDAPRTVVATFATPAPSPPPPGTPISFADVPADYWAHDQIITFAQRGITTGCGDDEQGRRLYCPERGVTRAEMAVFITRTLGQDQTPPPATPTFADVPADYWAYGQIEAFVRLGITTGCGEDEQGQRLYCPDRGVTRAEMAAFLDRAKGQGELFPATATFADVPPSYWAYGWIERFFTLNITTGCGTDDSGNRVYCPDRGVTRAEMAVFIIRAYP